MSIVEHLEAHLGTIAGGWSRKSETQSLQVVRFADRPDPSVSTFATLGLSRHVLAMPREREVRQELLFAAHDRYPADRIASFLLSFAEYVGDRHRALLRGDVVGPADPLIPGVAATAVYASLPVVYPDGLATFRGSEPPTVLVWLIPLLPDEAPWVKAHGWSAFEDRLEAAEPDLFDLDRPPVV